MSVSETLVNLALKDHLVLNLVFAHLAVLLDRENIVICHASTAVSKALFSKKQIITEQS